MNFEDALQYYSAKSVKADYIITRNTKDFTYSDIKVLTPREFTSLYL
jgi:predicted nucleic acid-binding protein